MQNSNNNTIRWHYRVPLKHGSSQHDIVISTVVLKIALKPDFCQTRKTLTTLPVQLESVSCNCFEENMMTSSNGNIFRVTGPLCGEFTGLGEFPTQRPVTWSFDVFFDLRLNKQLSKQPWGWWFETLSWSLWRQCNVDHVMAIPYYITTASHGRHGVSKTGNSTDCCLIKLTTK